MKANPPWHRPSLGSLSLCNHHRQRRSSCSPTTARGESWVAASTLGIPSCPCSTLFCAPPPSWSTPSLPPPSLLPTAAFVKAKIVFGFLKATIRAEGKKGVQRQSGKDPASASAIVESSVTLLQRTCRASSIVDITVGNCLVDDATFDTSCRAS